jgi:RNA polymerase sigma-70 factor, ECF subfamily
MNLDQIEAQRKPLTGHCYRMLGSAMDADDAVQETMIRAWKGFHQFDGRASLRTWLYRIATNVCLDEIAKRGRRSRPMEEGPPASSGAPSPENLIQRPRTDWIEPIADDYAIATDADPYERPRARRTSQRAILSDVHET